MERTKTAFLFICLILSLEIHAYRSKYDDIDIELRKGPTVSDMTNGTVSTDVEDVGPPLGDFRDEKFLVTGFDGEFGYQVFSDEEDGFSKLVLWQACDPNFSKRDRSSFQSFEQEFEPALNGAEAASNERSEEEEEDDCEQIYIVKEKGKHHDILKDPVWRRESKTMIIFADSLIRAFKTEKGSPSILIDGGAAGEQGGMQRVTWELTPQKLLGQPHEEYAKRLERFQALLTMAAMADSDIDQPTLTTCSYDPSSLHKSDNPCEPRFLCEYSLHSGGADTGTVCRPVVGDKPMATAWKTFLKRTGQLVGYVHEKRKSLSCRGNKCDLIFEKISGRIDLAETIINAFDSSEGPLVDPEKYPFLSKAIDGSTGKLHELHIKVAQTIDVTLKGQNGQIGDACAINVQNFKFETLTRTLLSLPTASPETCGELENDLQNCEMLLAPLKPSLAECQREELAKVGANISQSLVQLVSHSSTEYSVQAKTNFFLSATFGILWLVMALAGAVVSGLTYVILTRIGKFVVRQVCSLIHGSEENMTPEQQEAYEICGYKGRRISQIVSLLLSTGAAIFIAGPFGYHAALSLFGHQGFSAGMTAGLQGVQKVFEAGGMAYVQQLWLPTGHLAMEQLAARGAFSLFMTSFVPGFMMEEERLNERHRIRDINYTRLLRARRRRREELERQNRELLILYDVHE